MVEHIINTSESHAIAMEKDNQYYEMVQKEERAENERLREELKNLEAINAMARTKQIRKEEQKQNQTQRALKTNKRQLQAQKRQAELIQDVESMQADSQAMAQKIEQMRKEMIERKAAVEDDDVLIDEVFSSTANGENPLISAADASRISSTTGSAKKKRRAHKKSPNAARYPPPNLPPMGDNFPKDIRRVGMVYKPIPIHKKVDNAEVVDQFSATGATVEKHTTPTPTHPTPSTTHTAPTSTHPAPITTHTAPISTTPAPSQTDFSRLIHSLEIDAVRRNVVAVRPKEPFQKYDPKRKGQYNTLMNAFDSAFGFIEGISGNEKITELAGHWFAGAARKAINAAKPTANDPHGHVAYAKVRTHLDAIYGQTVDSAAEALATLKEGGVASKNNLTAYQDLYMNLLEAESAAMATGSMELLNRKTSILEIMNARIPDYVERFFEEYEQGDGYQKLLDFVQRRIDVLRDTQLPTQKTQVIKIHATEAREVENKGQQYGPKTYAQGLRESPKKEEKKERCSYCQGLHHTTLCNRLFILSLPERVEIANKARMCFHCAETTHNAKDCPNRKEVSCSICGKKGHITLFHGRNLLNNNNNPSDRPRQNTRDNNIKITNPPTKALMDIPTSRGTTAGKSDDDDAETPTI